MSKGLEALESLMANYYEMCVIDNCNDDMYQKFNNSSERGIIEKELKALEIIKENALYADWTWLFDCIMNNKSYEDYIDGCNATKETTYAELEEYNLFKEVLL